eukprot:3933053-Rhodomonas_salina.1
MLVESFVSAYNHGKKVWNVTVTFVQSLLDPCRKASTASGNVSRALDGTAQPDEMAYWASEWHNVSGMSPKDSNIPDQHSSSVAQNEASSDRTAVDM